MILRAYDIPVPCPIPPDLNTGSCTQSTSEKVISLQYSASTSTIPVQAYVREPPYPYVTVIKITLQPATRSHLLASKQKPLCDPIPHYPSYARSNQSRSPPSLQENCRHRCFIEKFSIMDTVLRGRPGGNLRSGQGLRVIYHTRMCRASYDP